MRRNIIMTLMFLIGAVSVQAQTFNFDCETAITIPEEGGVASHILSHDGVTLNTITGKLIVQGIEFEKRGDVSYAPDGWSHPHHFSNARVTYADNLLGLHYSIFDGNKTGGYGRVGLDQFSELVDKLLDKKGPSMFFFAPGGVRKLSVNNRFLRDISEGRGTKFETDAGNVYDGFVQGHMEFNVGLGKEKFNIDLRYSHNVSKVYRSNVHVDNLEAVIRTASADFKQIYNVLPTVGHADGSFWYNNVRWARAANGDTVWSQPANIHHQPNHSGVQRDFLLTKLHTNDWILKYNEATTGSRINSRGTLFEMVTDISNLLKSRY